MNCLGEIIGKWTLFRIRNGNWLHYPSGPSQVLCTWYNLLGVRNRKYKIVLTKVRSLFITEFFINKIHQPGIFPSNFHASERNLLRRTSPWSIWYYVVSNIGWKWILSEEMWFILIIFICIPTLNRSQYGNTPPETEADWLVLSDLDPRCLHYS